MAQSKGGTKAKSARPTKKAAAPKPKAAAKSQSGTRSKDSAQPKGSVEARGTIQSGDAAQPTGSTLSKGGARRSKWAKGSFLAISDWSRSELDDFLDLADRMKSRRYRKRPLAGKTLGMIFEKSSTRTRVSFEVGTFQLGGHALFLSARDIQLGRGEPIRDMARVLSRYLDGIMIRTFKQSDVEELAQFASIPVINGLTDLLHPCQVMADVMTIREEYGRKWTKRSVAWVGDGNNMANSWLNAAAAWGFELRLACPEGYEPDQAILERARSLTEVKLTRDPREAIEGADVITTDVWTSMGQEAEVEARQRAFKGYFVDEKLMGTASKDSIFLHCLPAHRGEEVSDGVMEGPRSRVFDEAENRLHVQKAIMARLMG